MLFKPAARDLHGAANTHKMRQPRRGAPKAGVSFIGIQEYHRLRGFVFALQSAVATGFHLETAKN